MKNIFYKPDTGEILGFSDGELSMEMPHVVVEDVPMPLTNYFVTVNSKNVGIAAIKDHFTEEEWNEFITPKPLVLVETTEISDEEARNIQYGIEE